MSAVPYTFAENTGNIPLSELDANFANCKAFANTAGYVTINAQPAITSVGTLTTLSVSGNIVAANLVGNVNATSYTGTSVSVTGNVTGGNIVTSGIISATGWFYGNQVTLASDIGLGGEINAVGNISAGNVLTAGIVSAVGIIYTNANVVSNNISAINSIRGNLIVNPPVYSNITANATTQSLSTTNSLNILIANNTGYTITLNMPEVQQDGQICQFAVHGNTMTLVAGIGNVLPTFAGSATVGTSFKYVYNTSNGNWYKI
jgi:hypothetical protein